MLIKYIVLLRPLWFLACLLLKLSCCLHHLCYCIGQVQGSDLQVGPQSACWVEMPRLPMWLWCRRAGRKWWSECQRWKLKGISDHWRELRFLAGVRCSWQLWALPPACPSFSWPSFLGKAPWFLSQVSFSILLALGFRPRSLRISPF